MEITKDNFLSNSFGFFKPYKTIKRKPDLVSENGDEYWFSPKYLTRKSNNWGVVGACAWHYEWDPSPEGWDAFQKRVNEGEHLAARCRWDELSSNKQEVPSNKKELPPHISREDFFTSTAGIWKVSQKTPTRNPDFVSPSGSLYWYEGDKIIRMSDHWGRVASCLWHLDDHDKGNYLYNYTTYVYKYRYKEKRFGECMYENSRWNDTKCFKTAEVSLSSLRRIDDIQHKRHTQHCLSGGNLLMPWQKKLVAISRRKKKYDKMYSLNYTHINATAVMLAQ